MDKWLSDNQIHNIDSEPYLKKRMSLKLKKII